MRSGITAEGASRVAERRSVDLRSRWLCSWRKHSAHDLMPSASSTLTLLAATESKRGRVQLKLRDWDGLVRDRTDDLEGLGLVSPGAEFSTSWAGPFRGVASDEREYFIKTLETCPVGQGSSLAVELIVGRAGKLIGAPVCETALIRIPDVFDNWEIWPNVQLKAGWAHGSLALERAREVRPELAGRGRDDNRARHVGAYALYDWCFGSDRQWLQELAADQQLYSHDHGLYFPSDGQKAWTREMLLYEADNARLLPDPTDGLSPAACASYAEALEAVTRTDLVAILNSVPQSWPVSDDDLEALGWFLEYRAPLTAERVRQLSPALEGEA